MFTDWLQNFFFRLPIKVIFGLGFFLAGTLLLAFVLFFISEVKKRTAKKKKFFSDAALFVLLVGLYGVFYIVKLLFAQELRLRIW